MSLGPAASACEAEVGCYGVRSADDLEGRHVVAVHVLRLGRAVEAGTNAVLADLRQLGGREVDGATVVGLHVEVAVATVHAGDADGDVTGVRVAVAGSLHADADPDRVALLHGVSDLDAHAGRNGVLVASGNAVGVGRA